MMRVGIPLEQIAADDEHDALAGRGRDAGLWLPSVESGSHSCSGGMSLSFSARCASVRAGAAGMPCTLPELPERRAAVIGRILPPEQLARELVVEPDHVGLDERRVGQHQRDRVRRHQARDWARADRRHMSAERLVHRLLDVRIGHHRHDALVRRVGQAAHEDVARIVDQRPIADRDRAPPPCAGTRRPA